MQETLVDLGMTCVQKSYYQAIFARYWPKLALGYRARTIPLLLLVSLQLYRCIDYPLLLEDYSLNDSKDASKSPHRSASVEQGAIPTLTSAAHRSSKVMFLESWLPLWEEDGHVESILIVSQLITVIDFLSDHLLSLGYSSERLGEGWSSLASPSAQTQHATPSRKSQLSIYLLCSRQLARVEVPWVDKIIMYDTDWNPKNDLPSLRHQHTFRPCTSSPSKRSHVLRLLSSTFEKHIYYRSRIRSGVDNAYGSWALYTSDTVANANETPKEKSVDSFHKQELETALKKAAVIGCLMSGRGEVTPYSGSSRSSTSSSSSSSSSQHSRHSSLQICTNDIGVSSLLDLAHYRARDLQKRAASEEEVKKGATVEDFPEAKKYAQSHRQFWKERCAVVYPRLMALPPSCWENCLSGVANKSVEEKMEWDEAIGSVNGYARSVEDAYSLLDMEVSIPGGSSSSTSSSSSSSSITTSTITAITSPTTSSKNSPSTLSLSPTLSSTGSCAKRSQVGFQIDSCSLPRNSLGRQVLKLDIFEGVSINDLNFWSLLPPPQPIASAVDLADSPFLRESRALVGKERKRLKQTALSPTSDYSSVAHYQSASRSPQTTDSGVPSTAAEFEPYTNTPPFSSAVEFSSMLPLGDHSQSMMPSSRRVYQPGISGSMADAEAKHNFASRKGDRKGDSERDAKNIAGSSRVQKRAKYRETTWRQRMHPAVLKDKGYIDNKWDGDRLKCFEKALLAVGFGRWERLRDAHSKLKRFALSEIQEMASAYFRKLCDVAVYNKIGKKEARVKVVAGMRNQAALKLWEKIKCLDWKDQRHSPGSPLTTPASASVPGSASSFVDSSFSASSDFKASGMDRSSLTSQEYLSSTDEGVADSLSSKKSGSSSKGEVGPATSSREKGKKLPAILRENQYDRSVLLNNESYVYTPSSCQFLPLFSPLSFLLPLFSLSHYSLLYPLLLFLLYPLLLSLLYPLLLSLLYPLQPSFLFSFLLGYSTLIDSFLLFHYSSRLPCAISSLPSPGHLQRFSPACVYMLTITLSI